MSILNSLIFYDHPQSGFFTTLQRFASPRAPLPLTFPSIYHGIESTSCQSERNLSTLGFLIGNLRNSLLPAKVERMMFLWLNRLYISEGKTLRDVIEGNKSAVALAERRSNPLMRRQRARMSVFELLCRSQQLECWGAVGLDLFWRVFDYVYPRVEAYLWRLSVCLFSVSLLLHFYFWVYL